jgi:hypothetical protein
MGGPKAPVGAGGNKAFLQGQGNISRAKQQFKFLSQFTGKDDPTFQKLFKGSQRQGDDVIASNDVVQNVQQFASTTEGRKILEAGGARKTQFTKQGIQRGFDAAHALTGSAPGSIGKAFLGGTLRTSEADVRSFNTPTPRPRPTRDEGAPPPPRQSGGGSEKKEDLGGGEEEKPSVNKAQRRERRQARRRNRGAGAGQRGRRGGGPRGSVLTSPQGLFRRASTTKKSILGG